MFIHSGIYYPGLSDHPLIYAFMKEKVVGCGAKIINFRSMQNFDEQKFKQHLSSAPWHVSEIFEDREDQIGFLIDLLIDIVDEHMPRKQMRVRDRDVPNTTTLWKNTIRLGEELQGDIGKQRHQKTGNSKEDYEMR